MLLALPKFEFSESKAAEKRERLKSQYDIIHLEVLQSYVFRYLRKEDAILISSASGGLSINDIYDCLNNAGYHGVLHLVENEKTVKNMKKKAIKKGKQINLAKGTFSEMPSESDSVNVVLDLCATSQFLEREAGTFQEKCNKIFGNISRMLKDAGRYLCMMDANEPLIDMILSYFKDNWFIRLQSVQVSTSLAKQSFDTFSPLVLFVLTKLKMKLQRPVMETSIKTEKAVKVDGKEGIKKAVFELWGFSYLQYKLRHKFDTANSYSIDFWCPKTNSQSPRYTVIIIDSPIEDLVKYSGKFGVFIVPQGREIAWLFASDKGRQQLASMSGFERIAITLTHRGHLYGSLEDVQSELSTKVLQLAPPGLSESVKVPFVTVGEDVGQRYVIYDGSSHEERCIVEDVKMEDGSFHRRLVFDNNHGVVQTEYRLLNGNMATMESTKQCEVDKGYLLFAFHRRMVAALAYIGGLKLDSEEPFLLVLLKKGDLKILLIGLGGAAIPNFIAKVFPRATTVCVELSPIVVELAKKWFGFEDNEKTQTVIADGLKFMESEIHGGKEAFYDAIIFDVNTNDDTTALTAPPMEFVETSTIDHVITILKPSGIFIVNLVCRHKDLRIEIANNIKTRFGNGKINQGDEDDDELNVILSSLSPNRKEPETSIDDCLQLISEISEKISESNEERTMNLEGILENAVDI